VDVWSYLFALLRPLAPLVEVVFLIIFAVAAVIARVLLFVLTRVRGVRPPVNTPTGPDPFGDFLKRLQHMDLPPQVTASARWGMVIGVVVVLSLLVALAVIRSRRRVRKIDDDERESVWSLRSTLRDLGMAWRSLWKRSPSYHSAEAGDVGGAAIRELYRQLLRIGAEVGLPRLSYQTPYEYLPRLRAGVPNRDDDLGTVTEAYVRVRYAQHTPAEEEIVRVRTAVEAIRQDLDLRQG